MNNYFIKLIKKGLYAVFMMLLDKVATQIQYFLTSCENQAASLGCNSRRALANLFRQ